jgi:hypothetical protein
MVEHIPYVPPVFPIVDGLSYRERTQASFEVCGKDALVTSAIRKMRVHGDYIGASITKLYAEKREDGIYAEYLITAQWKGADCYV